MNPVVSIIIVNYSTPELVYDCLASITKHLSLSHETIIVDNGAKIPLNPAKLQIGPQLQYISVNENKGFGGGNNIGVAKAQGQIVWLLNSDTLLPDNSIEQAIAFMQTHPEVGALTPLLFNDIEQKILQADFYAHFQTLATLIRRKARANLIPNQEWQPVDMVVAASILIP